MSRMFSIEFPPTALTRSSAGHIKVFETFRSFEQSQAAELVVPGLVPGLDSPRRKFEALAAVDSIVSAMLK